MQEADKLLEETRNAILGVFTHSIADGVSFRDALDRELPVMLDDVADYILSRMLDGFGDARKAFRHPALAASRVEEQDLGPQRGSVAAYALARAADERPLELQAGNTGKIQVHPDRASQVRGILHRTGRWMVGSEIGSLVIPSMKVAEVEECIRYLRRGARIESRKRRRRQGSAALEYRLVLPPDGQSVADWLRGYEPEQAPEPEQAAACAECGKPYDRIRWNQKYCGIPCRTASGNRAYLQRVNAREEKEMEEWASTLGLPTS